MKMTKTVAPKVNPQRTPRERRMDRNTVSRPRRVKPVKYAEGPTMTVDEFVALGGVVQRLTASWEGR